MPITSKVIWHACRQAATRAGLGDDIHPHTLRHYAGFWTIPGALSFRPIGSVLAVIFPA
jgi:site-specific recombinase XerD